MDRLQSDHSDLINDQFDFELTGAVLLGKDIAEMQASNSESSCKLFRRRN